MNQRFIKLSFSFLALFLVSSLCANAQKYEPKWSGVHVGIFGGSAAGNLKFHESDGTPGDTEDISTSMSGARFGVNAGMDVKLGGLVLGAMADYSWTDVRTRLSVTDGGTFEGNVLDAKVKQMTTVRGRVGKSFGRVLPYVHGGWVLADTELGGELLFGSTTTATSKTHSGYVIGGGIDYAFSRHVYLTTEYSYNHISDVDFTAALGGGAGDSGTLNPHISNINVGFNYRF